MRSLAVAVALVLAVSIGCTSFSSVDDDTSPPGEGDAGADAALADGGVPQPPDAASPDAGCIRAIDEHFANDLPSPVLWPTDQRSGTVAYSSSEGKLAPGAVGATVVDADSGTKAYIERHLEGLPSSATLSFAMRAAKFASQYLELGCTLRLRGTNETSFVGLHPYAINGAFYLGSTSKRLGTLFPPGVTEGAIGTLQPSHWYSVKMTAQAINETTIHFRGSVDDVQVLDTDVTLPEPTTSMFVHCGIGYGDPGPAAEVFVDDVVLDACQ